MNLLIFNIIFTLLYVDLILHLTTKTFKGCQDQVTKKVQIFERPKPVYSLPIDSGCSPLVVSYIDSTVMLSGDYFSYQWRIGDGAYLDEESTVVLNLIGKQAFMNLDAIYTSGNGCESMVMLDSMVQLAPQPKADFTYSPSAITTLDPLVHFNDKSRDANYWGWIFLTHTHFD